MPPGNCNFDLITLHRPAFWRAFLRSTVSQESNKFCQSLTKFVNNYSQIGLLKNSTYVII